MNPQMLALMKQKLAQRKQMGGQPPQGGQMGGMGRPPMGGMPQPQGQPPMGPGMPGAMPPQGGMPGMPMQGMTNPEDEKLQRLLEILKMI